MNITTLEKTLKYLPKKYSVMLRGIHGCGKTEWVKSWAKRQGMKIVIWHASHAADAGDITGLPSIIEQEVIDTRTGKSEKTKLTRFAPPEWMIHGEPVVLLLDEINRAMGIALNAIMQLTNDQTYDGHGLPEGSRIIACINPDENGYNVSSMDGAQLDRFAIYEFKPSAKEWFNWAENEGKIDPRIISYLRKNEDDLDPYSNPALRKAVQANPDMVLPSRRSYEHLSDFVKNADADGMLTGVEGNKFFIDVASGIVGPTIANNMAPFIQKKLAMDPEKYLKCKKWTEKETETLMNFSRDDTAAATRFMDSVASVLHQAEDELKNSIKTDKKLIKLYATNFMNILNSVVPEIAMNTVNSVVLNANETDSEWVTLLQYDEKMEEAFTELYSRIALAETI